MGILFGGVSDDDKDEETLDSTFYNDLCVPASRSAPLNDTPHAESAALPA